MRFRSLISALAVGALASVGWSLGAAAQQTDVNVFDDDGNLIQGDVREFEWSTFGSGVAKDVGPFGADLTIGQTFEFLYQSNLLALDNVVPDGLVTLSNGGALGSGNFQFTIVASITESVSGFLSLPDREIAAFTPESGTLSIFYDDGDLANTRADTPTGTGFDDGIEIARFSLAGGTSTFTACFAESCGGANTGSGDTALNFLTAFVDETILQGVLAAIMDLEFESNLQFPPGTSFADAFHIGGSGFYPDYLVNGDDIVFKVDGSNTFTTQVPEPATLGLLGAGLLGLCLALRRRSQTAA